MNKILKVLTLVVLILVICITTSKVYAIDNSTTGASMGNTLSSGGSIRITRDNMKNNPYIFCRDYGTTLQTTDYSLDRSVSPNPVNYSSNSNDRLSIKRGYIISSSYSKDIKQKAYWGTFSSHPSSLPSDATRLIGEAEAYATYIMAGTDIRIENSDDSTTSVINNAKIYGPIKIQYNYSNYGSTQFGGFDYAFYDTTGNTLLSGITLCKKTNDTTYTDITSTSGNDGYKAVRTSEYNNKDLYVKVDNNNINAFKLKIKNSILTVSARVYQISGTYYTTGGYYYCTDCQDKLDNVRDFDNSTSPTSGTIVKYNGGYYIYKGATTAETGSPYQQNQSVYNRFNIGGNYVQADWPASVSKYYCPACGGTYSSYRSFTDHCNSISATSDFRHYTKKQGSGLYECSMVSCNHSNQATLDALKNHYKTSHAMKYYNVTTYNFVRYTGCSNSGCGWKEAGTHNSQKLSIVDYSRGNDAKNDEIDIQLLPEVKFTIQKYDMANYTTSGSNGDPLQGAEFTVEAKQDGKTLTVNNKGNGKYEVQPQSNNRIYVLIKETKAPKGFELMESPINMIFEYNREWNTWYMGLRPSQAIWNESGFTNSNDFGGWIWQEDIDPSPGTGENKKNDVPNPYISQKGDKIVLIGNNTIQVFDEPKIEKLTLLKIDEDDQGKLLGGAKFDVIFENVKSFKFGNVTVDGKSEYKFENGQLVLVSNNLEKGKITGFMLSNGQAAITDVMYEDVNAPIKITIEEVEVPTASGFYYKRLEDKIVISITHTSSSGVQAVIESYNGTENIRLISNGTPKITDGRISYNSDGSIETQTPPENNPNLYAYEVALIIPNLRLIDLGGLVWVDGTTGIKPVMSPNGIKDDTERLVSNVKVEIMGDNPRQFNNETLTYIDTNIATTGIDGTYRFIGLRWNKEYFVTFNYDGIHYIASNLGNYTGAKETAATRTSFNNGYKIINNSMELSYEYNENKNEEYGIKERTSILETLSGTNAANKLYPVEMSDTRLEMGNILSRFNMTASTTRTQYDRHNMNLNLGILKRGTDLALSTNVYTADVSINGQTTTFDYDLGNITIDLTQNDLIGSITSDEKLADYSNYIHSTDYYYRMRKFESNPGFVVTDVETPDDMQTGDELSVYVTYILQLENQSSKFAKVNKIRYNYSHYYTFDNGEIYYLQNGQKIELVEGTDYTVDSIDEMIDINKEFVIDPNSSNGDFGGKTLYLKFMVTDLDLLRNGSFSCVNKAEIMEYETEEGLIDLDSQPGNYMSKSQIEDDNDQANGIELQIADIERTISGFVWEDTNKNGTYDEGEARVDDVIVQLVELKEENGKNYEYIWQETLSGSKNVKRIAPKKNNEGKFVIENYSNDLPDGSAERKGQYKFEGFIPGDYVIRFIYGDGTTYDLTDNMRIYNGQDYKSTIESKYESEWYNNAKYNTNVNIVRDNEARRLETMSWSANINARKGILLKLLDGENQEFNLVEKEELFNALKDFKEELNAKLLKAQEDGNDDLEKEINEKISELDNIGGIPDSYINLTTEAIKYLLKNVTLDNTWMCAETAKIKVPVESETLEGITKTEEVEGVTEEVDVDSVFRKYKHEFESMSFGLAKRPETKIAIEKKLTQMVLRASNGQTIVSAYFEDGKVQGQTDGLQVINLPGGEGKWIFSVSPTDINTIIDGASLKYTYKIIVKNNSDEDTIGGSLFNEYANKNIDEYKSFLTTTSSNIKKGRDNGYQLGKYLGSAYYTGSEGVDDRKVQTEVTSIYDYINNELTIMDKEGGLKYMKKLELDEPINHYLLNDTYTPIKTQINTVLENSETAGKMNKGDSTDKYEVSLGKDPLSSTSTLDFMNYIAEVMSFTNAAGRRGFYESKSEDGSVSTLKSLTPGNAEAVNKFKSDKLELETDEARVEEVQIQPALGEDQKSNYIWLISVAAGIVIIAAGAFVTKKYIIK